MAGLLRYQTCEQNCSCGGLVYLVYIFHLFRYTWVFSCLIFFMARVTGGVSCSFPGFAHFYQSAFQAE